MANQLKMGLVHTVLSLHRLEWSDRRIARELGIHRETVGRHIRLAEAASKPATEAPLGSDVSQEAPTGSVGEAKPANQAPLGSPRADLPPAGGENLPQVLPDAASHRPLLDAEAVPAARPAASGPLGGPRRDLPRRTDRRCLILSGSSLQVTPQSNHHRYSGVSGCTFG